MKKLSEYYAAAVAVGELDDSPNQRAVLDKLQAVADAIDATHHTPWWRRLLQRWWRVHSPKGLYLHGPVGAGKTYLMDMFYGHVPESHKRRFHFHKFMQYLDDELRHHQGRRAPFHPEGLLCPRHRAGPASRGRKKSPPHRTSPVDRPNPSIGRRRAASGCPALAGRGGQRPTATDRHAKQCARLHRPAQYRHGPRGGNSPAHCRGS